MRVLTCPKALWTGEGGGAWSPVHIPLELSRLLFCSCGSAKGMTFLGTLRCGELLSVVPETSPCSLSTVYLQKQTNKQKVLSIPNLCCVCLFFIVCIFQFLTLISSALWRTLRSSSLTLSSGVSLSSSFQMLCCDQAAPLQMQHVVWMAYVHD